MKPEIKKRIQAIKTKHQRCDFIRWARSERYTFREIGGWLGVTRARVWQLIQK